MVISIAKKKMCHNFDTDVMAKRIWLSLAKDFRSFEGADFCKLAEDALLRSVSDFRDYTFPEMGIVSPSRFKMRTQLSQIFKKYRFQHDRYDDATLRARTLDKFWAGQQSIATSHPSTFCTHEVYRRARFLARKILGKYDPEATIDGMRFGSKSSIGCPLSLAYIDIKLSDIRAFTGSHETSSWFFDTYLKSDTVLESIVRHMCLKHKISYEEFRKSPTLDLDTLNLVPVPKTWKIERPITPLTLLALAYSYGVGAQITEALKVHGLDIRRLQKRHGKLIQRFSRTRTSSVLGGSHATADLSDASLSLTSEMLNRVLPREWYTACKKTFVRTLCYDGKTYYTPSVLPMGNGLTFPVETLVFYCIIKAIGELTGINGIYSVYGDDLIYPSKVHKYVAYFFPRMGLTLNLDKTFVTYPFRESCGSDYYRGADVRPFFLPDACRSSNTTQYVAWLHQVYNGLSRRWHEYEIRNTLQMLLAEISFLSGSILRIPPLFPDYAGIKVSEPRHIPCGCSYLEWSPITCTFSSGSRWFSFNHLTVTTKDRKVVSTWPYFWLSIRGQTDDVLESSFWVSDYSFYGERPRTNVRWLNLKRDPDTGCFLRKDRKKSKILVSTARTSALHYNTKKTRSESISDWL